MTSRLVFLSHASIDHELAMALKTLIEDAFADAVKVFVSSDPDSIAPGDVWFNEIQSAMQQAEIFASVLTPESAMRPWVMFEAGAARGRGKPFIGLCTKGLPVSEVGQPLELMQLSPLLDEAHVHVLIESFAKRFGCTSKIDANKLERMVALTKVNTTTIPTLTPKARLAESQFRAKMSAEFDVDLAPARQIFWEVLDKCYAATAASDRSLPRMLNDLVDGANPPIGLPVPLADNLREYPVRYAGQLTGLDKLLYDFCCKVYPARQTGRMLAEISAIPPDSLESFHLPARGVLARFWNRWGEQIYDSKTISFDTVIATYENHYRLVKILSYLEIALVLSTGDKGSGKRYLFRLARDWALAVKAR